MKFADPTVDCQLKASGVRRSKSFCRTFCLSCVGKQQSILATRLVCLAWCRQLSSRLYRCQFASSKSTEAPTQGLPSVPKPIHRKLPHEITPIRAASPDGPRAIVGEEVGDVVGPCPVACVVRPHIKLCRGWRCRGKNGAVCIFGISSVQYKKLTSS
jgi:hypothetical protein